MHHTHGHSRFLLGMSTRSCAINWSSTSRAFRGICLMSTSIDVTLLVTRYSSSQLRRLYSWETRLCDLRIHLSSLECHINLRSLCHRHGHTTKSLPGDVIISPISSDCRNLDMTTFSSLDGIRTMDLLSHWIDQRRGCVGLITTWWPIKTAIWTTR